MNEELERLTALKQRLEFSIEMALFTNTSVLTIKTDDAGELLRLVETQILRLEMGK